MKKKFPLVISFVFSLILAFGFQSNESYAATYKSGYAEFKSYYITNSFYLPKGTYLYQNKRYGKGEATQYSVCIYKGSTPSNCQKLTTTGTYQTKYTISSSGYYKIHFTNLSKQGSIHIVDYRLSK